MFEIKDNMIVLLSRGGGEHLFNPICHDPLGPDRCMGGGAQSAQTFKKPL